jgi:uncharacterized protein (UPF0335 family)
MARGRKSAKQTPNTNGFDPAVLQDVVSRLDELDATLASERGKFMKRCRDIAEDRKGVMTEAKARGIPLKPLKTELKIRKLSHKMEEMRSELETEDLEQAKLIQEALGDYAELPLGKAAVDAEDRRQADGELVDDLAD